MRLFHERRLVLVLLAVSTLFSLSLAVGAQEQLGGNTNSAARKKTTTTHRRRTTRHRTTVTKPAPTPTTVSVPAGTNLKVRLNDTLSSKSARVGDKFTVTVMDPVKYNEARIDGYISSIEKSGKIKGRTSMNLDFTRITMPDGRTGTLHGYVSKVYGDDAGRAD